MNGETIPAAIVIEFDLADGETFVPMLEALREAMHGGVVRPRAVHGAIREAADRVMAALADEEST